MKLFLNNKKMYLLVGLVWTIILAGCAATSPGTGGGESQSKGPSLPLFGGSLKIGYVRSDVIAEKYQDFRDADNQLKSINQEWLVEDETMSGELIRKEADLEELRLILSDERRKSLEDDLIKLRRNLQKFRQDTWYDDNSKYTQKRKELNEPINARVNDAIWEIAEEKDLDVVFDSVSGNIVYADVTLDITELVLEELER